MNFFEQLSTRPHDADETAEVSSRRQLLLAAAGVLAIAGSVVLAAGMGPGSLRPHATASAPAPAPELGLLPALDPGEILARSGFVALWAEPVSARLLAGQSMMTRGYRTTDGRHEFAIVTPEVVHADHGNSLRMNLRLFSLDDAQLVLAGLETSDAGHALRQGGSRIWSAEDINRTLAALPPDIHRTMPPVIVDAGGIFSTTLGESGNALFFLEGRAVPADDGTFELQTDLKAVAKNS